MHVWMKFSSFFFFFFGRQAGRLAAAWQDNPQPKPMYQKPDLGFRSERGRAHSCGCCCYCYCRCCCCWSCYRALLATPKRWDRDYLRLCPDREFCSVARSTTRAVRSRHWQGSQLPASHSQGSQFGSQTRHLCQDKKFPNAANRLWPGSMA